jgi:hypothetical protein
MCNQTGRAKTKKAQQNEKIKKFFFFLFTNWKRCGIITMFRLFPAYGYLARPRGHTPHHLPFAENSAFKNF